MANAITFFELNTGVKFPSVGLGTWQASPGLIGDAVAAAVKVGEVGELSEIFQWKGEVARGCPDW
ncbi:expressed protein [Arabidopsis lyrata subsp. lyrata]|uniref:Expressed protein n=1 Tax=Arabidopsis lyrata subsp. lyrata TaxID=81972 RepID=D7L335_ARALL|nr:expressed protein [Arabidopsis lyrata subsp. lyrata]